MIDKIGVIRTSDRNSFRSCRRKWNWSSHLRGNLGAKTNATPLWAGSGFHFVMEDYHGYRKFKDPVDAWHAYVAATLKFNEEQVPDDYEEASDISVSMIEYYKKWEESRSDFILPTLWLDGKPQVEVGFKIDIPLPKEMLEKYGYSKAVYSGTMDRMVIDETLGLLWVLDYKTAKVFNTQHFQTDSQVTTYTWAASEIYDMPVAGMIYAQHLKKDIKQPKVLKSGIISTAQNQVTSTILYRLAMLDLHGSLKDSPEKYHDYLKTIEQQESNLTDRFIRHDKLQRSPTMQASEGVKILMEAEDMLNPELALYPNATRDCTYMCSFNSACVGMDDGSDYEAELEMNFRNRPSEYDGWRADVVWPEDIVKKEAAKEQHTDWDSI